MQNRKTRKLCPDCKRCVFNMYAHKKTEVHKNACHVNDTEKEIAAIKAYEEDVRNAQHDRLYSEEEIEQRFKLEDYLKEDYRFIV